MSVTEHHTKLTIHVLKEELSFKCGFKREILSKMRVTLESDADNFLLAGAVVGVWV